MRRSLLPMCALAAASFSGGLTKFSAGAPAQASAVNDNFAYLDTTKASKATVDLLTSAVNAKAEKSSLDAKADNARVDSLKTSLAAKAEKSDLATLQAKVKADSTILAAAAANGLSMTTVNANLAGLRDTVAKKKDSAWIMKSITPAAIGALPASGGPYLPLNGGAITGSVSVSGGMSVSGQVALPGGFIQKGTGYVGSWIKTGGTGGAAGLNVADSVQEWIFEIRSDGYASTPVHAWAVWDNTANVPRVYGNASGMRVLTPLTVDGKITAANVAAVVKSSDVADYVFEPSYKLAPLAEVEAFTKEHKHLPEVPSAKEIENGGLDLAQMNLVLLKKVEELTLHAIDQQKAIEAQRQEMSQMRAELEVLKVR